MPAARLAHVQNLLNQHATIRALVDQRGREIELLDAVRAQLPTPLREHCLDVSIAEDCMTLFLDAPAWATRIRFLADDIIASLSLTRITRIRTQIRVDQPKKPAADEKTKQARGLTASAARHLLDAAEDMEDPTLRETFRRFALRHVEHTAPDEV